MSSFLGKFAEQVLQTYHSGGRKRAVDVLLQRIQELDAQESGNELVEQTGDDLPASSFIVK
jgi:hypothetical protein